MVKKAFPLSVAIASSLLVVAEAATFCNGGNENVAVQSTTPSVDFQLNDNGTAIHVPEGLMWMRCSLGQTWDRVESQCKGTATTINWNDAVARAENTTFAGYSDWRLPDKSELATIVELRCWSPVINVHVFPNTPSAWYWSSTPYPFSRTDAWGVYFGLGSLGGASGDGYLPRVRLVRDAR
ncbi:DUF1566 domain-containing protein [Salinispirillum sp. LH 10-3-1]|uniref:DUF1566 domain-containing protein n=1 Tax=Salinispirillum sp. LH 10-3-1 TaxID=2952525 RepID=A0AB38YET2_9GAMM